MSSQKTIGEMLQLHNEMLAELNRVIPFAEFDQTFAKAAKPTRPCFHARWHSVDGVLDQSRPSQPALSTILQGRRSLSISRSPQREPVMLHCTPRIVADVAAIFHAFVRSVHHKSLSFLLTRPDSTTCRLRRLWCQVRGYPT